MTDGMEVYPLTLRGGDWWLSYGLLADAETLAAVFRSDCTVPPVAAAAGGPITGRKE